MQPNNSVQSKPKSSKKIIFIVLISIFTVFVVLPILIIAWLGFVPGLSKLFGSSDAKNLGVTYTQTDLDNYHKKINIQFKPENDAPIIDTLSGEKTLLTNPTQAEAVSLTNSELSAALNNLDLDWIPVQNIQAKVNSGSLELSGKLNSSKLDDFYNYLNKNNNIDSDASSSIKWAQRFTNNAPIYLKASGSISNNILSFQLTKAQIGRINIPLGNLGEGLNSVSKTNVKSDNFNVDKLELLPGRLSFTGRYPTIIYIN